jgi:myosin heavy subunit
MKALEKQELQDRLNSLSSETNEIHLAKTMLFDRVAPIARLINCNLDHPDFFDRLQVKLSQRPPETQQLLSDVADLARITRTPGTDEDIPRFLNSVAFRYERLLQESRAMEEAERTVQTKLNERKVEITEKRERAKKLQTEIKESENALAAQKAAHVEAIRNHERERDSILQAMREAERRTLRSAAKAAGLKRTGKRSPSELIEAMVAVLEWQIGELKRARMARDQKDAEFPERLAGGITVVEGAANAISHANRKLLRAIRGLNG